MSLKLLLLSAGLLPSLLLSSTADVTQQPSVSAAKRFSINMMDPFTRRSALDKNFVRFGRSGTQRVPRGRNDNFVRFGRSGAEKTHVDDEDDVTMFPSKESELIRLARARADNFIRFGRAGRPDNFIRFGRGMDRTNNGFIRFGRGRPDNFIRFGRGRPDNFIRFGRGRPDNFIRFGRDQQQSDIENRLKLVTDAENQLKLVTDAGNQLKLVTDAENQFKPAPGTEIKLDASDFSDEDGDDYSFERVMRGSNSKLNSNFVRFGKRVPENNEEIVNAYKNGLKLDSPQGRDFLERFIRLPSRGNMKSDSFIRFGRSLEGEEGNKNEEGKSLFRENSSEESSDEEENFEDSKLTSRDPNIVGTSYESSASSQTLSRKKRSVDFDEKNRDKNLVNENSNQSSSFYSPLAAGLPGLILGPELSMLPVKENSKTCNDSKEEKTKNFIRLG